MTEGAAAGVATSHPDAVAAGEELLRRGGTAVDAAVGMAAALTVVEPTSNGLGSDAFAIVWDGDRLTGLNGSGRSPASLDAEVLRAAGHASVPPHGWEAVTVPGAVAAWRDLHARYGRLDFAEVLAPAVRLARDGYVVPPVVAHHWDRAARIFGRLEGPAFAAWSPTFLPDGRVPGVGERIRFPDHARTLERIAASNGEDFYRGDLAGMIDRAARETGGWLRGEDLAAHSSDWVEPVPASYRDVEIWELPPNGQGVVALAALRILDGLPGRERWGDPEGIHVAIEAVKLAFADAEAAVTDPAGMKVSVEDLLDEAYLEDRRRTIGPTAAEPGPGAAIRGGTVLLVAADRDGMMVSFIQSNYMGFGSGVVVPGTGIALQNRGAGFTLEVDHPNVLAPGKRPFHTIIPAFLTRQGMPWGPMGVMGGHHQPQGHVQVVRGLVDGMMDPQTVLDLPRWHWRSGLDVDLEEGWSGEVVAALETRGHRIRSGVEAATFGRGQILLRNSTGLVGGSDRRADGDVRFL